ncbi:hypothetical protein G6F50_016775 [Rhizopus delemar]|uniref:Uncharacterized protein n=1 Tax=Rhizopus delemar TaxID=936053 RepID=A0A9P7C188_9FUNG|nr:hypothetical protein G6F50_016775 [Rhizopus delemar]
MPALDDQRLLRQRARVGDPAFGIPGDPVHGLPTCAGHQHRDAIGHRFGHHVRAGQRPGAPVDHGRAAVQGAPEDIEMLAKEVAAPVTIHTECGEFHRAVAGCNAQQKPAATELVNARCLFGQMQGMPDGDGNGAGG